MLELDFGSTPLKLHEEYLDVYEGIQLEIVNTTRFNENSDLSMPYLGRLNKARNYRLKAEESFPISEHGYTIGKLLDGTECQLLLDTGASKSFYVKIILHAMQVTPFLTQICIKNSKDTSRNGQCVCVLFIIPVIINVHGHRFEIYTLVSEIHKNIDLVLGIKNVFKLEGVIDSRDCCFKFLIGLYLYFQNRI